MTQVNRPLEESELAALTALYLADIAAYNGDMARFGHPTVSLLSQVRARLTEELVRRGVLLPDQTDFNRQPEESPKETGSDQPSHEFAGTPPR